LPSLDGRAEIEKKPVAIFLPAERVAADNKTNITSFLRRMPAMKNENHRVQSRGSGVSDRANDLMRMVLVTIFEK